MGENDASEFEKATKIIRQIKILLNENRSQDHLGNNFARYSNNSERSETRKILSSLFFKFSLGYPRKSRDVEIYLSMSSSVQCM